MVKFKFCLVVLFLFINLISISSIYAADFSNSVSATSVQFSQPSVNNIGFEYSSLISGSTLAGNDNELYDMQLFIPPMGCKPYVVRSDLLEEQNVPVFCEIMALNINPGVDINRIDRISTKQLESNPYIAGIGFYPARAAIRAKSSMTSIPADNTLGYVVVVLKKQNSEKDMPESVNTTLSAYLDYGADNAFGIGQTEYYLPVITDEEFNNNYVDYGFFNGLGYVRAESVSDKSATIAVYSSGSYASDVTNLNRVWSNSLETGKTSSDFYLNTLAGGQKVRITLDEVTVPKVKAKVVVNGQTFEVYKGGKFYNNKCTLTDVVSNGGGSGTAKVSCPGKSFSLVKKFNQVSLNVRGNLGDYAIGDKIDLFNSTVSDQHYYFAYLGETAGKSSQYIFLAKDSSNRLLDSSQVAQITKSIGQKVKDAEKSKSPDFSKITSSGTSLIYIKLGEENKNTNFDVAFSITKSFDKPVDKVAGEYYNQAIKSYDVVESKFGSESNLVSGSGQTYGVDSLWNEYNLASTLLLQKEASQILSRIASSYPDSLNKVGKSQQTASQLMAKSNLLSNEGSSDYDTKSDIYLELVSVIEPSKDEASVSLTYQSLKKTPSATDASSGKYDVREKESFVQNIDDPKLKITLDSFTADNAYFSYECSITDAKTKAETKKSGSNIALKQGEIKLVTDCDFQLQIDKINLKRVAKIQITPSVAGRTRESNFTFSIGIEKRAFAMNLTPAEANTKMEELNKMIADLNEISNSLKKVIETGKLACLATNAYLNLKVAFSGSSASARTEVMTREGGWNSICKDKFSSGEGGYSSIENCISENSDLIEKDIEAMARLMEEYNSDVKAIEKSSLDAKTGKYSDKLALDTSISQSISAPTGGFINEDGVVVDKIGQVDGEGGKSSADIIKLMNASLGDIGWTDSRALSINLKIIDDTSFSDDFRKSAQKLAYRTLNNVNEKQGDREKQQALAKNGLPMSFVVNNNLPKSEYKNLVWDDKFIASYKINSLDISFQKNIDKLAFVPSMDNSLTYLINLKGDGNTLTYGGKIYSVSGTASEGLVLTPYVESSDLDKQKKPNYNAQFIVYDDKYYKNVCKNCNYMEVFSLEPNKGQPALLPFDDKEGWYVYTQSAVGGFGSAATYQDSGRINSFYLCNVGKNGLMDSMGSDDICMMFNTYTGQSASVFPNLDSNKAKTLIGNAVSAIESAQRQLTADPKAKFITVNGLNLKVVSSEGTSGTRCTDFMSSSDCSLMFNVCDPFVCPSSRCDLGGEYPVDNVIQSGIVGSTVLCLPNFVGFEGGDVYVPVCITGINAGLEGWASIVTAYRDCINESVTTNKTIGICDQMYSIYACDFMWKNVGPFASAIAKNIFSGNILFGKGGRGGGEYMFTENAFSSAEKSWKLFSSTYASNSKLAFGGKSFAEIGSDFCKAQISATYPNLGSILSAESPVQITASFEESPYTDATIPPTSQYKVFYHIYAGNDSGASYQVYLKDGADYPGYVSTESSTVATGYINAGGSKTETKDYLDVSGFKQLCVRINAKDYCGFKQVSTSFALNYVKDKVVADQATTKNIASEEECISGSSSLSGAALSMGNLQSAAQSTINPQIYEYGIVRICSTTNPGAGTDQTRWTEVGNCGNTNLKCWLDGKSVKNAINGKGIENQTLEELESITVDNLVQQGYMSETKGSENVDAIKAKYADVISAKDLSDTNKENLKGLDAEVDAVYQKLVFGYQKVKLLYIKSLIYDGAARITNSKSAAVTAAVETKETKEVPVPTYTLEQLLGSLEIYRRDAGERVEYYLLMDSTKEAYLYDLTNGVFKDTSFEYQIIKDNILTLTPQFKKSDYHSLTDFKVYQRLLASNSVEYLIITGANAYQASTIKNSWSKSTFEPSDIQSKSELFSLSNII